MLRYKYTRLADVRDKKKLLRTAVRHPGTYWNPARFSSDRYVATPRTTAPRSKTPDAKTIPPNSAVRSRGIASCYPVVMVVDSRFTRAVSTCPRHWNSCCIMTAQNILGYLGATIIPSCSNFPTWTVGVFGKRNAAPTDETHQ